MNKLKRKIKYLESSMNKENDKILEDCYLLKRKVNDKAIVLLEIGGGFLAGYLLASKKSKKEILDTLLLLSLRAGKIQKSINLLSVLIKKP